MVARSACQRCGIDRVASIVARCKDQCWIKLGNNEQENYVPNWLGNGDDIRLRLCLSCGQVQGEFPRWTHWERGEDG
jgi:hypothetical protein